MRVICLIALAALGFAAPAGARPHTIAAVGDIACNSVQMASAGPDECHDPAIASLTATLDPEFVLVPGDVQYQEARLSDFQANFGPRWEELLNTVYPAPGNHEYLDAAGAAGYYAFFGERAGPDAHPGYYSVKVGEWLILSLNSERGTGASGAQAAWLEAQLASTARPCVLAFWHKPIWSSSSELADSRTMPFWQSLAGHRADIVLNGHAHAYERFTKKNGLGNPSASGVREIVVGTGGYDHRPFDQTDEGSVVRNNTDFGVLELVLDDGSYSWRFVAEGGAVLDWGGPVNCHAPVAGRPKK